MPLIMVGQKVCGLLSVADMLDGRLKWECSNQGDINSDNPRRYLG